jgi:serine/threonine protein kinase
MLHKLHSESVIFRDLKPENIMINRATGMLTLVDFGFAKQISQHGRTFTKCGTPGYSAPEVLQQADTSDNTDDSY